MNITNDLEGMTPSMRREFLETNATAIVEGQYFRPFDSEDKQQTQSDFTLKSIELSRIKEEFKAIRETYKKRIKTVEADKEKMMQNIMQNGEWLDGRQYGFDDQSAGTMTYYDEQGQFINSRRLTPNERQISILSPVAKAN